MRNDFRHAFSFVFIDDAERQMTRNRRALSPKNVLEVEDTVLSDTVHLKLRSGIIYKAAFITETEVALQGHSSIEIYNPKANESRSLHIPSSDSIGDNQFFPLNNNTLIVLQHEEIFRNVIGRISFWSVPFGKSIRTWRNWPGADQPNKGIHSNFTRVAVLNDNINERLILAQNRSICVIRVKRRRKNKLQPEVVAMPHIQDWNDDSDKRVLAISVHAGKMAIHTNSRIILSNLSNGTTLNQLSINQGVLCENSLTTKYLAYVDWEADQIIVRDVDSFEIVSTFDHLGANMHAGSENHLPVSFKNVTFSIQGSILTVLLTYRQDEEHYWDVCIVSSVETHEILFKRTSESRQYRRFTPQLHRQGLVLPDNNQAIIVTLSQHIINAAFAMENTTIEVHDANPLFSAFIACFQQEDLSVLDLCNELITFDNCKQSLREYFSAHRLLMLGVQEKLIARSTDHGNEHFKWFTSLYNAGSELTICGEEERNLLKSILSEAQKAGLIDSGETVLSAHEMKTEYRTQHNSVLELGIKIVDNLVSIKDDYSSLKNAFELYKKRQNITHLAGIALNLIPFFGGSFASAALAGAEVLEGLAIGEVVEFGLETQTEIMAGSETLENLLFRYTSNRLEREKLDEMSDEARENLIAKFEKCKTTPEVLYTLFRNGANGIFLNPDEIVIPQVFPTLSNAQSSNAVDHSAAHHVGHNAEILHDSGEEADRIISNDRHSNSYHNTATSTTSSSNLPDVSGDAEPYLSTWALEDLENFEINKGKVETLKRGDASILLAAHICDYEPEDNDKFEILKDVVHKSFSSLCLNGSSLSNRNRILAPELTDMIFQYIEQNHRDLYKDPLRKVKIMEFIVKAST